ncbi:flagella basal body P-ring formation protein FlgA [Sphingomonas sp. BK069]|uniref:flagella basal body P-ring formation protein FlgA n=1 Tax=Sphingomonas sp. BK069 TaxID=2586979 RepID=UPI00160F83C7|nr:flagella basal body P-ring formation protein FlgA [Sphingomonas sp. BK069]MBB3347613.1 flagella basal body P-ring formation protein FlgA [Sphingomonas sp. BK069]
MIAALLLAAAATGAGFQDTEALDRAVAAFTARPIGSEGGARAPVDARLRLAACPMVAMSWRTEAHDAVVIACAGPSWRLFVPVIAPPRAAGAVAPRTAAAAAMPVRANPVIRRGDAVTIEAGSDGFAITREGVAIADAAPGARVMIKVDDAPRPVQAVAVEAGRATLPGWPE